MEKRIIITSTVRKDARHSGRGTVCTNYTTTSLLLWNHNTVPLWRVFLNNPRSSQEREGIPAVALLCRDARCRV